MGPSELRFRIARELATSLEQFGIGRGAPQDVPRCEGVWVASSFPRSLDAAPYLDSASRITSGKVRLFGHAFDQEFPPPWNRDPKTGILSPLTFGKRIDYRDDRRVGDIKYVWEMNRHADVVRLAQAWRVSGDGSWLVALRTLLESWFEQCPFPYGVQWTSSLEHGLRLISWMLAWHISGGLESPLFVEREGEEFRKRWMRSIYEHCRFISGYLSRYSSANNHLLGELAGLFVASCAWPAWPECDAWRKQSKDLLEVEFLRQNSPDGVNREHAFWYQHAVAELMLICILYGRANGAEFSGVVAQRLESMVEFLCCVMDASGAVPNVGDSDDADVLPLAPEQRPADYKALLGASAVLFERGDFAKKVGEVGDKERWLLGDECIEKFSSLLAKEGVGAVRVRREFPQGGYTVLGSEFDTSQEVKIVADAGALGYLSIAAHGHADALAMTLSVGGSQILVDSGTYAYHTQREWRDYFRGTAAHNTVRVDGCDQSVISGNFMWRAHAHARCHVFESNEREDVWEASHDGYRRLSDPVTHRRRLQFDKATGQLTVDDTLECCSRHYVEVFWHFHPDCRVRLVDSVVHVESDTAAISLSMGGGALVARILRGSTEPIAGWYSRRFDEKQPATTVVFSGQVMAATTLSTRIAIRRTT